MRWLDRLATLAHRSGLRAFSTDREDFIRTAEEKTGLTDFGNPRFREALDRLMDDHERTGSSGLGKLTVRDMGVQACVNRLRLREHLRQNPDVAALKVERPLFILGFPRTGTTLLQNLLALSPDRRALPFWEISSPVPLHPDPVKDVRMRMDITKRRLLAVNLFAPEMRYIHEVRYDSYEECWPILGNSFSVFNWDMSAGWPQYGQWLLDNDLTWAYEEYRDALRVMSSRVPDRRLILKSPDHLWTLDAVLKVFPDAAIVWTHRDPARSVPSYCSLGSLSYRVHHGECDLHALGSHVRDRFKTGIDRALEVRGRVGEERFFDVSFPSLLEDPKAVVHGITSHFGLTPVSDADMDAYLGRERNDERGNHQYEAGDYGLSKEGLHSHFSDYIQRFGIPLR